MKNAFSAILSALEPGGAVQRLFAMILRGSDGVDSLRPLFEEEEGVARDLAPLAREVHLRPVFVPCDGHRVLVLKIDLARPLAREEALRRLRAHPGILVRAAADGFPHTAAIAEFFRDAPGPDAGKVFVWEETVLAEGSSVLLTAAVAP